MSRLVPLILALLVLIGVGAAVLSTRTPPPEPARLTAWPAPGNMPGFGDTETLGPSQIADLTEYVLALAGAPHDEAAVVRAVPLYQAHCAACHGLGGEGAEMLGAPDLTRREFRQVRGADDIRMQIWHGSDGRGPVRESGLAPRWPRG